MDKEILSNRKSRRLFSIQRIKFKGRTKSENPHYKHMAAPGERVSNSTAWGLRSLHRVY
jgi:hypothetical protein